MIRRFRTPSIWHEMNRMQREMDKLFNEYSPRGLRSAPTFPAINIWADEDSALVTAEIPGVDKGDLEINVTGDTLSLSGERKMDEVPEGAQYHRRERSHGKFTREIQMPYTVDANKVKAKFKNGVLEVILPRVEAEKPKRITVKAS